MSYTENIALEERLRLHAWTVAEVLIAAIGLELFRAVRPDHDPLAVFCGLGAALFIFGGFALRPGRWLKA